MALSAFGVEDTRQSVIAKDNNNGHGGLGLTAGLAAGGTAGYLARPKLKPLVQNAAASPLGQKVGGMAQNVAGSPAGQKIGQAAGAVGNAAKNKVGMPLGRLFGVVKADDRRDHPIAAYTGGAAGGYIGGSMAGRQIGARTAGRTPRGIKRDFQEMNLEHQPAQAERLQRGDLSGVARGIRSAVSAGKKDIPGFARMARGGEIGALAGTATGVGGVAAYRHSQRKR